MKKMILKAVEIVGKKMAIWGSGIPSLGGCYQPKEPENLSKAGMRRERTKAQSKTKIIRSVIVGGLVVSMMIPYIPVQAVEQDLKLSEENEITTQQYIIETKDAKSYTYLADKYEEYLADVVESTTALEEQNILVLDVPVSEDLNINKENGVVTVDEDIILYGSCDNPIISEENDVTEQTEDEKTGEEQTEITENVEEDIQQEIESELPSETEEAEDNEPTDEIENETEATDSQWYLDAINLPEESDAVGTDKIKVEVLDSGVSFTDDIDIKERVNLIPGEEEVSPLYDDGCGHGTAIAGVIGAKDNDDGISGVNPNADIYSVKVLDSANQAPLSRVIDGIYWGIEHNMNIINMSLGTTVDSPALHNAVIAAKNAGILLVAAGGNEANTAVQYPAAYDEVIAVGATNAADELISEYSLGTELEIVAPGDKIVATGLFDGELVTSGTSIATAQVTAAASMIWQIDKSKSSDFIRWVLSVSSKHFEYLLQYDAGLLDIEKAINNFDFYWTAYQSDDRDSIEKVALAENPEPSDYDTQNLVNGLWTTALHGETTTELGSQYINTKSNVAIMAEFAQKADTVYGKSNSPKLCRALHGTGNYVASLKYLYEFAHYIKLNQTAETAKENAWSTLSEEVIDGNVLLPILAEMSVDLIDTYGSGKTAVQKKYMVAGFIMHLIGDTYAHRTVLWSYMVADDSSMFNRSDFASWSTFKSDVENGNIDCRKIKHYQKDTNDNVTYEDNPDFYAERYTASVAGWNEYLSNIATSYDENVIKQRYMIILDQFNQYKNKM